MELTFEGLEKQKWNIPTDRAQRVHKKNGVICLVIMFTPRVRVFKKVFKRSLKIANGSSGPNNQ